MVGRGSLNETTRPVPWPEPPAPSSMLAILAPFISSSTRNARPSKSHDGNAPMETNRSNALAAPELLVPAFHSNDQEEPTFLRFHLIILPRSSRPRPACKHKTNKISQPDEPSTLSKPKPRPPFESSILPAKLSPTDSHSAFDFDPADRRLLCLKKVRMLVSLRCFPPICQPVLSSALRCPLSISRVRAAAAWPCRMARAPITRTYRYVC